MVKLELIAICWAAKKCASFIHGLPLKLFEIWTDHAPLILILNKYTLPEIINKHLQQFRAKFDQLLCGSKATTTKKPMFCSESPIYKPERTTLSTTKTATSPSQRSQLLIFLKDHTYTTTQPRTLRDENLLELRAHQDQEYEQLKATIIKLRIAAVGPSPSGLWYTYVHAKQLQIDPMYM
jgi:hypothetical protein